MIDPQRIAADPTISAFVTANAGSGKTKTLIDRVARLLLGLYDPRFQMGNPLGEFSVSFVPDCLSRVVRCCVASLHRRGCPVQKARQPWRRPAALAKAEQLQPGQTRQVQ